MDDTHPRAARVLLQLTRAATPAQRFAAAADLTDAVIQLSIAGLAATMPTASRADVALRWAELHYGAALAQMLRQQLARAGSWDSTGS